MIFGGSLTKVGGSNASEQSATDEKDKRDLLHKIAIGRERLRRMPGGESRAGGESWFKEVSDGRRKSLSGFEARKLLMS